MKCLFAIALLVASTKLFAGPSCLGKVKAVMDWPEKCANGNVSYLFQPDGSNNELWVCSISDKSASITLAALAADKSVRTVFSNQEESCTEINTNYLTPMYLYVQK